MHPYASTRPTWRSYLRAASCRSLFTQVQRSPSAQTNPTPDITLTSTLTLTPTLWGAQGRHGQSRGFAACFGGVSTKKSRWPKAQSRPIRPAPCRKLMASGPANRTRPIAACLLPIPCGWECLPFKSGTPTAARLGHGYLRLVDITPVRHEWIIIYD